MESEQSITHKPVVMFSQSKGYPSSFTQAQALIEKTISDASLSTGAPHEEMYQWVQDGKRGIFVFTVSDREELTSVMNFIVLIKQAVKERRILVVVFARVTSDKIEEVLLKAGCYEVLRFDVGAKSLLYKVKRYLAFIREEEADDLLTLTDKATRIKDPGSETQRVTALKPNLYRKKGVQILESAPLVSEYDFWIFKKKLYAKKFKNSWLIELIGPSPAAGKWIQTDEFKLLYPSDDTRVWKWVTREQSKFKDQFSTGNGSWVFVGNQPEYNWVINRWGFVSRVPELSFIEQGQVLFSRLKFKNDEEISVSKNSEQAVELLDKLRETFDQDYFFQLEKLESKNFSITQTANTEIPWADQLDSKKLSKSNWNQHDLSKDEGGQEWGSNLMPDAEHPDYRSDLGKKEASEKVKKTFEESIAELDVPLGAEAMESCGIKAFYKNIQTELIGYSETENTVLLGLLNGSVKLGESIEIFVESENLKETIRFTLQGISKQLQEDDMGRTIVTLVVQPDSQSKIKKIKEAIEQRQEEIFSFFNRVKGIG